MRLLNVKTKKLEEFFEKSIPKYAILSHTWGEDEVTFRDFDPILGPRRTSIKIDGCCAQALNDGHNYVWIDTCCIDKSSSAELSEAINSMFAWYKSAEELLAPTVLIFYNAAWSVLGHVAGWRSESRPGRGPSLIDLLSEITGIPDIYIERLSSHDQISVAAKMSWASERQTTRVEDMAYCLLGIFDVAMPMLYGEGMKAFTRLQEEIMKNVDDHSIFAWGYGSTPGAAEGEASVFARSPADFAYCDGLRQYRPPGVKFSHFVTTNKGLYVEMSVVRLVTGDYVGRIDCMDFRDIIPSRSVAIPLARVPGEENVFYRLAAAPPEQMDISFFRNVDSQPVYISRSVPDLWNGETGLRLSNEFWNSIRVRAVHPANWDLRDGHFWTGIDGALGPISDKRMYDQTIFLDCFDSKDDNFVVKIKYEFEWGSALDLPFLNPKAAKVLAARVPSMSLLEVIAAETQGLGEKISWQEDFIFEPFEGPSTPKFPGPVHSNCTRRIHLDQSKEIWEIDVW